MAKAAKEASVADRAFSRIILALDTYLADPADTALRLPTLRSAIPSKFASLLDEVLGDKRISYRDGLLIQAAFGLEDASREKRHTIRLSIGGEL